MNLSLREKQTFYQELEQFVRSGIPLSQAVEALLPETGYGSIRRVLQRLLQLLLQGESVPDAFAKLRPAVSNLEVSLIEASNNTGRLEQSFIYLANYFGALDAVRSKILQGTIWPAIQLHIGVVCSNLVPLFLGGLTPQAWNAFYVRCGTTLGLCYLGVLVLWLVGGLLASLGKSNAAADTVLGQLPLIGRLRRNLALSRFCAAYEMQVQGGINLFDSLRAAASSSQSARIHAFIEKILPKIRNGASFGSVLDERNGALPAALKRAIRVGEDTGKLDENLRRWADYYQQAAVTALDRAGRWIPKFFYLLIAGYLIYCILVAGQTYTSFMDNLMNGG